MSKKVELTRHEVLVPKSLKRWVVSTAKKNMISQAELTIFALNNLKATYAPGNK